MIIMSWYSRNTLQNLGQTTNERKLLQQLILAMMLRMMDLLSMD